MKTDSNPNHRKPCSIFVAITLSILLGSCASYGPYHANTAAEPTKSVRGPADGRYKMAFIEFGDQGSAAQHVTFEVVVNQTDGVAAGKFFGSHTMRCSSNLP